MLGVMMAYNGRIDPRPHLQLDGGKVYAQNILRYRMLHLSEIKEIFMTERQAILRTE